MNKNPARLGPKGYRDHVPTWDKEKEDASSSIEIHKITDPHARYYMLGRRMANQHGQLSLPNQLHSIAEQMIEKDTQISQGVLQCEPGMDPLTMVLGPEHPGRTRAVNHIIGLKRGLPSITKKNRNPRITASDWEERFKDLQTQFQFLKEEITSMEGGLPVGSPGLRKNSVGSTHNIDDLGDLDEIEKINCAWGMVYPTGNGLIHGVPICKGNVKVHIDRIEQRYRDIPHPLPIEEFSILHEAIHTFVQWPRSTVDLSKSVDTQAQQPTTIVMSTLAQQLATTMETLLVRNPREKARKSKAKDIEYLQNNRTTILKKKAFFHAAYTKIMSREDPTRWFDAIVGSGVFGAQGHEFILEPIDILDMMTNGWVDITIIIWFIGSLHDIMEQHRCNNNKCAFFNPAKIRPLECKKNADGVTTYIFEAMRYQRNKSFFLAPFWQRNLGVLFVILPQDKMGFILDSMRDGKTPNDYEITTVVESALESYNEDMNEEVDEDVPNDAMRWTFVNCNQQNAGWECGYYVMRWIHEFIYHGLHGFPTTIPWNDSSPFSPSDLDNIVGTWLGLFIASYF